MQKLTYSAAPAPYTYAFESEGEFEFCSELSNSRLLFREQTALYLSSLNGHVDVCKLLVASQADLNAKNSKFEALHFQCL